MAPSSTVGLSSGVRRRCRDSKVAGFACVAPWPPVWTPGSWEEVKRWTHCATWWRHEMETFSGLLALCVRNSPVTGEFPSQRPVTRSFDVFFDLCLNKRPFSFRDVTKRQRSSLLLIKIKEMMWCLLGAWYFFTRNHMLRLFQQWILRRSSIFSRFSQESFYC